MTPTIQGVLCAPPTASSSQREFGFGETAALASYLARLGISHLYASPYPKARPESTHVRINKTERNDAVGLAELLVSGWYKPVTVKSLESRDPPGSGETSALGAQDVRLCARQGARDVCRSRQ
jgi:hypothetical protein